MKSTVFVSHEVPVDYSHAERFGELRFIVRNGRDIDNLTDSVNNREVVRAVVKELRDYNPASDYLLISGSPYIGALCSFIIGVYHRNFRLLRWSSNARAYFPVEFSLIKERNHGEERDPEGVSNGEERGPQPVRSNG